ncbi:hypothetical protein ACFLRC_00755 [Candidatus Altiarchaeota archaeon]
MQREQQPRPQVPKEFSSKALKTVGKYSVEEVDYNAKGLKRALDWISKERQREKNIRALIVLDQIQDILIDGEVSFVNNMGGKNKTHFLYTASDENGDIAAVQYFHYNPHKNIIESSGTYVTKKARKRKGLGKTLLRLEVDESYKRDCPVECEIEISNEFSQQMVEASGFEKIGQSVRRTRWVDWQGQHLEVGEEYLSYRFDPRKQGKVK